MTGSILKKIPSGQRENENGGENEFKYIWHIVRTSVNDTMYLHPAQ
jgi:hypothetical protein